MEMPRKKKTPWKKRCDCRDPLKCAHPCRIRIKNRGHAQTWLNLTKTFPHAPPQPPARTPYKAPQGTTLVEVPKSGKRARRLEPGEEGRIRAVADDFMNDFLTAILFTGCRPGELRTLQWSEVGERIVILARKAKDREERKLPILPELRDVLDRRRKGPDGHPLPADAHVFGDDTGRLTAIERLCARWRDVCAKAKVVNLHLHDLRAEFGSRMIEAGVPIHQVRDALGHANVSMTSTYLRSRTDSLDDAYGQLRQHRKGLKLVVNK